MASSLVFFIACQPKRTAAPTSRKTRNFRFAENSIILLERDAQGMPTAVLVTNTDVTERKRAEQARKEIEEQWRAAFESNPTMYFILDSVGTIVSVNTFGAEKLGYKVHELIGQPVSNVFYPADSGGGSRARPGMFRAARPDDEVGSQEDP